MQSFLGFLQIRKVSPTQFERCASAPNRKWRRSEERSHTILQHYRSRLLNECFEEFKRDFKVDISPKNNANIHPTNDSLASHTLTPDSSSVVFVTCTVAEAGVDGKREEFSPLYSFPSNPAHNWERQLGTSLLTRPPSLPPYDRVFQLSLRL